MTRFTVRAFSLVAALSLGLLMVLAAPRPAYACSCGTLTSSSPADQADAIFSGRVLSTTREHSPAPGRTDIRFEVSTVYKGTVYQEQVVASPPMSDGCGLDFVVGSSWVIFAQDEIEGSGTSELFRLVTRPCSGNRTESADAGPLGLARFPLDGASDREEKAEITDGRFTLALEVTGLLALGLVIIGGVGLSVLWRPGRTGS